MLKGLVKDVLTLMHNIRAGVVPHIDFHYDYIMDMVRKRINDHGLRQSFLESKAFASVPYFSRLNPVSVLEHVAQGWGPMCLNDPGVIGFINWWQSTNVVSGPAKRCHPEVLQRGSFWAIMLEKCLGPVPVTRRLSRKTTLQVWVRTRALATTQHTVLFPAVLTALRRQAVVLHLSHFIRFRELVALLPISRN